ncbi:hypothetical protein [Holospora curviuscula]|uniref:CDP-Glycerol:Poly(Glycerophosphate) glycerophosphotransferase n=1 Tax=Holospora curviuscula TaxID=1082868 RepID=A0A2S5R772_9PROT|nr:hypothetical protein [Holospora curviuscula]PPE03137.1 hypothetical protein HCUR_01413 [Holospora curviuscula]
MNFFLVALINFFLTYFIVQTNEKKVLFIVHTETINGKGVVELYKKMKEKNAKVTVAFVPLLSGNEILYDLDVNFSKKFQIEDCIFPCGKTPPYKIVDKIKENFDYIFVQNPYNSFKGTILESTFSLENLKKKTNKLAYIVYGPHLFHQTTCNDMQLKEKIDIVFVDSVSTKKVFVEQMRFKDINVVVSGYQSYKNVRDKMNKRQKKRETILWMPRWTLHFNNRHQHESGSTFLSYYLFFINYAKENKHINFIIRPHVLLFKNAINQKFLKKEEVEYIILSFKKLNNVRFSEHINSPLEEDIIESDIVIADGTSALAEAVVAKKPIIYLSNGINKEFESNDLGIEFKNYIYFAHHPVEIIQCIENIRKNSYSPFVISHNSYNFVKKFKFLINYERFRKRLDPVENPAEFIADYVIKGN